MQPSRSSSCYRCWYIIQDVYRKIPGFIALVSTTVPDTK